MKVNVEVECTPAEARAFLGLPDVTPLNERRCTKRGWARLKASRQRSPFGLANKAGSTEKLAMKKPISKTVRSPRPLMMASPHE